MEITHDLLIEYGFLPMYGRANRYRFKGFTGRLEAEAGIFFFHGFSPGIYTPADLRYLMMMVDFQQEKDVPPFMMNDN